MCLWGRKVLIWTKMYSKLMWTVCKNLSFIQSKYVSKVTLFIYYIQYICLVSKGWRIKNVLLFDFLKSQLQTKKANKKKGIFLQFSLSSSAFISTLLWTSLSFSVRHPVCWVFVEMQLTHPVFSLAFSPSSSWVMHRSINSQHRCP